MTDARQSRVIAELTPEEFNQMASQALKQYGQFRVTQVQRRHDGTAQVQLLVKRTGKLETMVV